MSGETQMAPLELRSCGYSVLPAAQQPVAVSADHCVPTCRPLTARLKAKQTDR
jgi:hypothetical protein